MALAAATSGHPGSTGGAGLSGSSAAGGSSTNPLVQPANQTVSASGNGITVQTMESGMLSRTLRFTGSVRASDTGRTVAVELSPSTTASTWKVVARGRVDSQGNFTVRWHANRAGHLAFKAILLTTASAASVSGGAPAAAATAAVSVNVYRLSLATYYGPGFWGHQTACGQRLRRTTLGVASRTLRCGTQVSILFRGRSIVVPVIDRGPYGNGANWDLTEATAQALGMTGTSTIGALTVG